MLYSRIQIDWFLKIQNYYGSGITGTYIPNGTELQPKTNYKERLKSRDIIFVGSGHPPNKVAAKYIVNLAKFLPDFNFIIIGSCGNGLKINNIPENVDIVGHIDEESLHKYFKTSFAFINPMTSGSGTHLKMMKALSYGIPIITSAIGARGFDNDEIDESMIIAESIDDMKKAIENLDNKKEILTLRISDHDGLWTSTYDSAYLGNLELDDGSFLDNTPMIVLKEYNQQVPLSYQLIKKLY